MGRQLVGQRCVRCHERIRSELDARFCADCGQAAHTAPCPEVSSAPPKQRCAGCGGDRSLRLAPDFTGGVRREAAATAAEGARAGDPASDAPRVPADEVARLIDCPVCGRGISTAAAACPQCGHPNRRPEAVGPRCYACTGAATTRCQRCGALSCAPHLQSIYVTHGRGGAYELRCRRCHSDAVAGKVFWWVIWLFAIAIAAALLSTGGR